MSGQATAGAPAVPHSGPVSQDCPVECLRAVLPRKTYLALARGLDALPWPPRTVGDVIRLRAGPGLAVVGGLGPSRIADIEAGLDREGLGLPACQLPPPRPSAPLAHGPAAAGPLRFRAVALDFGGTISTSREDHVLGQKAVNPAAAGALRELAALGLRLVLASNATIAETRWPALQAAGVHDLFAAALISSALGVAKDDPLFYDLVITAARCDPAEILFAGDRIDHDVAGPMRAGMRACLVRPAGPRPGEQLPDGAFLISHVRELPSLLAPA